jgi:hypothetical protein
MELILALFASLLLAEAYVWLPKLCAWLIKAAVVRLPDLEQARYQEEWTAHLAELPHSALRVVHCLSLFLQAGATAREIVESKLAEFDQTVAGLRSRLGEALTQMNEVRASFSSLQQQPLCATMALSCVEKYVLPNRSNSLPLQHFATACREWARATTSALARMCELTAHDIESVSTKLAAFGQHIETITTQWRAIRARPRRTAADRAAFVNALLGFQTTLTEVLNEEVHLKKPFPTTKPAPASNPPSTTPSAR